MNFSKITFYVFLLLGLPIFPFAQKLPNIQEIGLRTPKDVKIDGKMAEWGAQLQAYNNATEIYYTMANDDDNLYLVIHATDPDVMTKITNEGVVLAINPLGKNSNENTSTITFPIFELQYSNKPYIHFNNMGQPSAQRAAAEANPDSMSRLANKKLQDNEKFIRTSGMPGVDTLLSIYNRKGIRVAEAFDSNMGYTYELLIPLKYLNLPKQDPLKLAYHIILPGLDIDKDMGLKLTKRDGGEMTLSFAKGAVGPAKGHLAIATSKTDFWGEYTLAKK